MFLNFEEYLPKIKTPIYKITAINQKNENSKNTEVWITNYKESIFIKQNKNNWFKKNGFYYANGKDENYIEVKNQKEISFIKHQWSGFVSIENTKTRSIETIDLYSIEGNNFKYVLDDLQTNFFDSIFMKLIFTSLIAFITHKLVSFLGLIDIKKININLKLSNKKTIYIILFFSLLPFIYLIAFYPGFMSPDSLDQWKQLSVFQFKDNHPAFHTLIYWLITRIYYSPISISIFQIICLSSAWTYGIISILKNLKPNNFGKVLVIFISLIFYISPQNGLMSITLWKDILFSYSILFLTINLFNIIFNKNWIYKNKNKWLLISSLVLVFMLRHNGITVYLGTIFSLFVLFKTKFLKIFLISVLIILFIKYPLYKILKVNKIEGSASSGYSLNYLNCYLYNDSTLRAKYKNFYDQLYPSQNINAIYNSYCGNYGVIGLNYPFFEKENRTINEYLKNEIIINPNFLVNEIIKRASLVWQIKQPSEAYTYTTPIDDYDSRYVLREIYGINSFNPDSKLTFFIRKLVYATESDKYKSLFWRPALNLILTLFISLYLFKKKKNILMFIPLVPLLSLSAGLFLTIPGQDYRYLYSNYLVSIYNILLLLNIKLKHVYLKK